jgi:hypothetical protein
MKFTIDTALLNNLQSLRLSTTTWGLMGSGGIAPHILNLHTG